MSMKSARKASIYPTAAVIDAHPEKLRVYIGDLETRCNLSGDVQAIVLLRKGRDALQPESRSYRSK